MNINLDLFFINKNLSTLYNSEHYASGEYPKCSGDWMFPRICTSDPEVSDEELKQYCFFVQNYTLKLHSNKEIAKFLQTEGNTSSDVFGKLITPSDEAYAMLIYRSGYEFWKENCDILRKTQSERERHVRKFPKKKFVKSEKINYCGHGWTSEGVKYYNTVLVNLKKRKQSVDHWDKFIEVWSEFCNLEEDTFKKILPRKSEVLKDDTC